MLESRTAGNESCKIATLDPGVRAQGVVKLPERDLACNAGAQRCTKSVWCLPDDDFMLPERINSHDGCRLTALK